LNWIEEFLKVNSSTIDLTIKNDIQYQKKKIIGNYLDELANLLILPEHYLNQTQLIDDVTPDLTHSSWDVFSNKPIGTGLMVLEDFDEGVETKLILNLESWLFNQSIEKNDMNFAFRFGNYANEINQLRIRIFPNLDISYIEFENGRIDLHVPIQETSYNYPPISTDHSIFFNYSTKPSSKTLMLIFNLRGNREYIANTELCYNYPEFGISRGLAIRKAISYAINRNEINAILHNSQLDNNFYPIGTHLGKWCYSEIPYYCHNYDYAMSFMEIAAIAMCCVIDEFPQGFPDWRYGCCDPCDITSSTVSINSYYSFCIFGVIGLTVLNKLIRKKKRRNEKGS
jgi:ABC-type transport system substrate-binding protein